MLRRLNCETSPRRACSSSLSHLFVVSLISSQQSVTDNDNSTDSFVAACSTIRLCRRALHTSAKRSDTPIPERITVHSSRTVTSQESRTLTSKVKARDMHIVNSRDSLLARAHTMHDKETLAPSFHCNDNNNNSTNTSVRKRTSVGFVNRENGRDMRTLNRMQRSSEDKLCGTEGSKGNSGEGVRTTGSSADVPFPLHRSYPFCNVVAAEGVVRKVYFEGKDIRNSADKAGFPSSSGKGGTREEHYRASSSESIFRRESCGSYSLANGLRVENIAVSTPQTRRSTALDTCVGSALASWAVRRPDLLLAVRGEPSHVGSSQALLVSSGSVLPTGEPSGSSDGNIAIDFEGLVSLTARLVEWVGSNTHALVTAQKMGTASNTTKTNEHPTSSSGLRSLSQHFRFDAEEVSPHTSSNWGVSRRPILPFLRRTLYFDLVLVDAFSAAGAWAEAFEIIRSILADTAKMSGSNRNSSPDSEREHKRLLAARSVAFEVGVRILFNRLDYSNEDQIKLAESLLTALLEGDEQLWVPRSAYSSVGNEMSPPVGLDDIALMSDLRRSARAPSRSSMLAAALHALRIPSPRMGSLGVDLLERLSNEIPSLFPSTNRTVRNSELQDKGIAWSPTALSLFLMCQEGLMVTTGRPWRRFEKRRVPTCNARRPSCDGAVRRQDSPLSILSWLEWSTENTVSNLERLGVEPFPQENATTSTKPLSVLDAVRCVHLTFYKCYQECGSSDLSSLLSLAESVVASDFSNVVLKPSPYWPIFHSLSAVDSLLPETKGASAESMRSEGSCKTQQQPYADLCQPSQEDRDDLFFSLLRRCEEGKEETQEHMAMLLATSTHTQKISNTYCNRRPPYSSPTGTLPNYAHLPIASVLLCLIHSGPSSPRFMSRDVGLEADNVPKLYSGVTHEDVLTVYESIFHDVRLLMSDPGKPAKTFQHPTEVCEHDQGLYVDRDTLDLPETESSCNDEIRPQSCVAEATKLGLLVSPDALKGHRVVSAAEARRLQFEERRRKRSGNEDRIDTMNTKRSDGLVHEKETCSSGANNGRGLRDGNGADSLSGPGKSEALPHRQFFKGADATVAELNKVHESARRYFMGKLWGPYAQRTGIRSLSFAIRQQGILSSEKSLETSKGRWLERRSVSQNSIRISGKRGADRTHHVGGMPHFGSGVTPTATPSNLNEYSRDGDYILRVQHQERLSSHVMLVPNRWHLRSRVMLEHSRQTKLLWSQRLESLRVASEALSRSEKKSGSSIDGTTGSNGAATLLELFGVDLGTDLQYLNGVNYATSDPMQQSLREKHQAEALRRVGWLQALSVCGAVVIPALEAALRALLTSVSVLDDSEWPLSDSGAAASYRNQMRRTDRIVHLLGLRAVVLGIGAHVSVSSSQRANDLGDTSSQSTAGHPQSSSYTEIPSLADSACLHSLLHRTVRDRLIVLLNVLEGALKDDLLQHSCYLTKLSSKVPNCSLHNGDGLCGERTRALDLEAASARLRARHSGIAQLMQCTFKRALPSSLTSANSSEFESLLCGRLSQDTILDILREPSAPTGLIDDVVAPSSPTSASYANELHKRKIYPLPSVVASAMPNIRRSPQNTQVRKPNHFSSTALSSRWLRNIRRRKRDTVITMANSKGSVLTDAEDAHHEVGKSPVAYADSLSPEVVGSLTELTAYILSVGEVSEAPNLAALLLEHLVDVPMEDSAETTSAVHLGGEETLSDLFLTPKVFRHVLCLLLDFSCKHISPASGQELQMPHKVEGGNSEAEIADAMIAIIHQQLSRRQGLPPVPVLVYLSTVRERMPRGHAIARSQAESLVRLLCLHGDDGQRCLRALMAALLGLVSSSGSTITHPTHESNWRSALDVLEHHNNLLAEEHGGYERDLGPDKHLIISTFLAHNSPLDPSTKKVVALFRNTLHTRGSAGSKPSGSKDVDRRYSSLSESSSPLSGRHRIDWMRTFASAASNPSIPLMELRVPVLLVAMEGVSFGETTPQRTGSRQRVKKTNSKTARAQSSQSESRSAEEDSVGLRSVPSEGSERSASMAVQKSYFDVIRRILSVCAREAARVEQEESDVVDAQHSGAKGEPRTAVRTAFPQMLELCRLLLLSECWGLCESPRVRETDPDGPLAASLTVLVLTALKRQMQSSDTNRLVWDATHSKARRQWIYYALVTEVIGLSSSVASLETLRGRREILDLWSSLQSHQGREGDTLITDPELDRYCFGLLSKGPKGFHTAD